MVNFLDVLTHAFQMSDNWSKETLKQCIKYASNISFNWDYGCGERWAIMEYKNQFLGYINCELPLCFIKNGFIDIAKDAFNGLIDIIEIDDFSERKWYLNLSEIKHCPNIYDWIADGEALYITSFSINDFWYATL